MNLGLSYLSQLTGFTKQTIQQLVTKVGAGYHKQHNADDTHSTVTATGPISERGRTVAMGAWTPVPFLASRYTATGTTWTVTNAQQATLKYMLVGTTLFVTFYINASTVGGATANLFITLPLNATSTVSAYGTCTYNDNGTYGVGTVLAVTGQSFPQLKLMKDIGGSVNWSNSAAFTVAGQIAFEVTGSI